jgi:hypothetical protein
MRELSNFVVLLQSMAATPMPNSQQLFNNETTNVNKQMQQYNGVAALPYVC